MPPTGCVLRCCQNGKAHRGGRAPRRLVEDNVAVVRAFGEERAVVVGHDWGSSITAACALLSDPYPRRRRVAGVASMEARSEAKAHG